MLPLARRNLSRYSLNRVYTICSAAPVQLPEFELKQASDPMNASSHTSALVYAIDSGDTSDHTDEVLPTYSSAPSSVDYAIGESEAPLLAYYSPT